MFETITSRLEAILKRFTSKGRLTEKNVKQGMREIRTALLEADVNLSVVKDFVTRVSQRALGQEVTRSVTPGQQLVKIVHDELVELMGPAEATLSLHPPLTIIMLCGLHGSGKTTTCAKLALYLSRQGHRPLLVAADVKRPGAEDQLSILGEQIGIPVYREDRARPPAICAKGVKQAQKSDRDIVVLDTAGRLHIDSEMMDELIEISDTLAPHEILYVCDAMTGQDAVNSAKEFNSQLRLTGVILTKLDGDARGGAALSVKAVTGAPIKFVGTGEKLEDLELFHPDRMAQRILGMGDIVTLVERAQQTVDREKALEFQRKIRTSSLTLQDFLSQLEQLERMGPVQQLLQLLPGLGQVPGMEEVDESDLKHLKAIIQSMTPHERAHPEIIDHSRRRRIAAGSGTTPTDVNMLLKQFRQIRKMLKSMKKSRGRFGFF